MEEVVESIAKIQCPTTLLDDWVCYVGACSGQKSSFMFMCIIFPFDVVIMGNILSHR
jgi:hypothetical protein